jgi:hypothetical protein
MAQIDAEYEAARRALSAPAMTARHDFIVKRMERIAVCQQQLVELVGDEHALTLMVQSTAAGGSDHEEAASHPSPCAREQ